MKSKGKWSVIYVRSTESEEVFQILFNGEHYTYERRARGECTEESILDSLCD
jgi:hypothetical protein